MWFFLYYLSLQYSLWSALFPSNHHNAISGVNIRNDARVGVSGPHEIIITTVLPIIILLALFQQNRVITDCYKLITHDPNRLASFQHEYTMYRRTHPPPPPPEPICVIQTCQWSVSSSLITLNTAVLYITRTLYTGAAII